MKSFLLFAAALLVFSGAITPQAGAEEETAAVNAAGEEVRPLLLDFSPAPIPDPESYSESEYKDGNIQVTVETREEDGVILHLAFVKIVHASQLRTWTANPENLKSKTVKTVSKMADLAHAVIAVTGDNYMDHPTQTTYEIRMGQIIRTNPNRMKDILIIDQKGDFHFIFADPKSDRKDHARKTEEEAAKYQIVNAYTFGPALVEDGQPLTVRNDYSYNPNRPEPRTAIGQTGELSYVLALAEGRGKSKGMTLQELADYMASLGCVRAYNLDGGNSAEIVFGDTVFRGQPIGKERGISDIIYFGTLIAEKDRGEE